MALLGDNLYGFLTADASLAALITNGDSPVTYRLFPVFAGENPTVPLIVFNEISSVRPFDFDGPDGYAQTRMQFDCFDSTYTAVRNLADKLRLALDGHSGALGDMDCHYAHLDTMQDFNEADAAYRRVSMDFLITHTETTS